MNILIADDNLPSRLLLFRLLSKRGYNVFLASDGKEALETLQANQISFVITDWMMPVMDGLELCNKIRNIDLGHYVYIVILTSKDNKSETVEALESGADDYIIKPFDKDELFARIRIGKRILQLEKNKEDQNRKLTDAYTTIKKDLEAAAKIQYSLLPKSDSTLSGIEFDWLFMPAAYIAGDIFNYFLLPDDCIGFYLLDVAGHGIPSALLSITLSKYLSPFHKHEFRLIKELKTSLRYELMHPKDLVTDLNQSFQADDESMQYFTMIYGVINTRTGKGKMTQAGHPCPVILKKDGGISLAGSGGLPVGLSPEATYEEYEFNLSKGDRFILYSDGIIECENTVGKAFSTDRLLELIAGNTDLLLHDLITGLEKHICKWRGGKEFDDDISILAFEIK